MHSYEKIKTFIPGFYLNVRDMDACYRVDGKMLDEFLKKVDSVKLNRFVLTADEETTERMERFLGIEVYKEKPLDERRRLILSYFGGFGKINKTKILEMIKVLCDAEGEVSFEEYDLEGNNCLNVTIKNPKKHNNLNDFCKIFNDRIPAHICYRFTFMYNKKANVYTGLAMQQIAETEFTVETNNIDNYTWLTDEDDNLLIDEDGMVLFDEEE